MDTLGPTNMAIFGSLYIIAITVCFFPKNLCKTSKNNYGQKYLPDVE